MQTVGGRSGWRAAIFSSVLAAYGCGGEDPQGARMPAGVAGTFGNAPVAGASGAGGFGNTQLPPTQFEGEPVAGDSADGASCGGESFTAQGKKLEIFVLFDNSGSMAIPFAGGGGWASGMAPWGGGTGFGPSTPWDAAVAEMKAFVMDPNATGISLAMKYFGEACEPSAYGTPDVAMAELPANGSLIASSLDGTMPNSNTATRPALEGALQYANARLADPNYNARIIVLLVTDGEPDQDDCSGNTLEGTSEVAAGAFMQARSIPTYVLSTAGDIVLDEISQAGGTGTAIAADVASPGVLSQKLIEISKQELAELPCEYAMPAGYATVNDPDLVNLTHDGVNVGRVQNAQACDAALGGWFYDDPSAPTQIRTCEVTCGVLKQGGSIDVKLGCPSEPVVPPE